MSVEQNKAIIRHVFDIVNLHDDEKLLEMLDVVLADEYANYGPNSERIEPGREGYKKFYLEERRKDPDVSFDFVLSDIIGEGEKIVVMFTCYWNDKESGERCSDFNVNILRFSDGKIVEEWILSAPMPAKVPTQEPATV
jgi:predicted SnoaL-like aldol condensation-catalyzing enzyme